MQCKHSSKCSLNANYGAQEARLTAYWPVIATLIDRAAITALSQPAHAMI